MNLANIALYRSDKALRDMLAALGVETLRTVMMEHRCRCFGLVMKHRDGWSIVYVAEYIVP